MVVVGGSQDTAVVETVAVDMGRVGTGTDRANQDLLALGITGDG